LSVGGLGDEIRKKLTKKVAFPLLNRLIGDRGDHLYHYSAEMDRLFPIRTFDWRTYRFLSTGELDSDRWWHSLRTLEVGGGTILDVGANTGYTAAWFSTIADRVYAFEPDPGNVEILREQIRIRGLTNVEIRDCAVSEAPGRVELHLKERGGHHALSDVGASATLGTASVQCTTVDEFMRDEGVGTVSLLKVDVEGFEPEVLRGARVGLSSGAIQRVLLEFSPEFYRRRGIDDRAPLTILTDQGFVPYLATGDPFDPDDPRASDQCDVLAFAPGVSAWES
jgi:FkbM family methyltransferase